MKMFTLLYYVYALLFKCIERRNNMQKNVLKSGIEISELGLGCMSLGTDKKQAEPIIERAIEHGITYFDTADMYDKGVNEAIVGEALKEYQNRDDIVLERKWVIV